MKNICMTILLFAWAMSQTFAQHQLAPSAESHLVNWTDGVKKLLTTAGFESSSLQKTQGLQTRSEWQLDSTLTFFAYDPTGTQDSTPLFRTLHTYVPSMGTEVVAEFRYEWDEWIPQTRTVLISDDLGRLTDTYSANYDPASDTWTLDSRLELYLRGNSPDLVDSMFVLAWEPGINDWVRLMSTWNSFDNEDRLTESLTLFDVFGLPLLFKDVYTYDANGDNILIESFLTDNGVDIPAGKRELTYENHHVTSVTYFGDDGFGGLLPLDRITYTYTGFWKEETVNTYVWDSSTNDWLLTQTSDFGYDPEQRLAAKVTTTFNPEEGMTMDRSTYSYLEGEYLALEANYTFDFDLDEFVLLDRKYFYYSGGPVSEVPNEPVAVEALGMSPNPTAGFVRIQLKEEARVLIFDMQGQLVRRFNLQPGHERLDLYDLPAGIYLLRAQTNGGLYAGKLVKQ